MQQDQVEVAFCDLCGTSVPDSDFSSGTAQRLHGKTIGACCLGKLRAATPVGLLVPASEKRPGSGDPRLVPVAIAVLAALAAATIFLDHQVASADARRLLDHKQLVQLVGSDHDAIQRVDVAMDGTARRADLDALGERLAAATGAMQRDSAEVREILGGVQKEVGGVQRDVRTTAATAIDYRPLFEDLRQQLQRQAAAIAELRVSGGSVASAPNVEPPAPTPVSPADAGANDLMTGPLGEHVRKLQSTDPAIRFEAVDALVRSKNPAILPHILPLARDPDSYVRRLTVEGLQEHKRPEVVESLLTALTDADELVREQAWRSLREVTGQKFPFDAGVSKDQRARAVQRWQEWWDKSKLTFGS